MEEEQSSGGGAPLPCMQMSPQEEEEEEQRDHRWITGGPQRPGPRSGGSAASGHRDRPVFWICDPPPPAPKHDARKERFGNFWSPSVKKRAAVSPVVVGSGSTDRVWVQVFRHPAAPCR